MRRLAHCLVWLVIWIFGYIGYQTTPAKSQSHTGSSQSQTQPQVSVTQIDLSRLSTPDSHVTALPTATTPSLSLGALSNFTWEIGAMGPGPETLAVTSSPAPVPFTATATGGGFTVSPTAGQTPAKVQVALVPYVSGFSAGTYPGTVTIASATAGNSPQTANVNLTLVQRIVLPSFTLAAATVGSPYVQLLTPTFGVAPYVNWTLSKGTLPPGLSLSANSGVISGFPTSAIGQPFQFSVQVVDSLGVMSNPASYSIPVTNPGLTVSPTSLAFTTGAQDTALPAPQIVSVFSVPNGTAFTAATDGSSWLSVSGGGTTAAQVGVSVNPAGLKPGTYQGSISLTTPNNLKNIVPVSLTVSQPSLPPQLAVQTSPIQIPAVEGQAPVQTVIGVSNNGGGTLNFTVSVSGGAWLSVSSMQGSVNAGQTTAVPVTIDVSSQPPGTYTGAVIFTNAATGATASVPVSVGVSQGTGVIQLSQTGLRFAAVVGGGQIPPQTFSVLNPGHGTLNWSINTQTLSGGSSWINVTPATGSSTVGPGGEAAVTVTVNPSSLAAGQYSAVLSVTSNGASNSPQSVAVLLNVLSPADQGTGPQFNETGRTLVGQTGVATPAPPPLVVFNTAGKSLTYTSTHQSNDPQDWLGQITSSGTLAAGAPTQIPIQANLSSLSPGVRNGVVRFAFSDGTVRTLDISSVVLPSAAAQSTSLTPVGEVVHPAASGCSPKVLVLTFAAPAADSFERVAQSESIRVNATDDCNNPATTGAVQISFSNGDPDLPLRYEGSGVWSQTWVPRGAGLNVSLTATAFEAPGSGLILSGQKSIQLLVLASAGNSAATVSSIVNAASYAVSPVTPGSWISIFGNQLASSAQTGSTPQSQLGDTQVFLGSVPLALNYVSAQQVNALIPYTLSSDTVHNMLVLRSTTASVPIDITVADLQPGIYSTDQSGMGQGAIYNAVTGVLADIFAPVTAGDYLSIACAGLGSVDQPPPTGTPAPLNTLANTLSQPTVTIGGVAANVLFSGLQPGAIGLYQVNVQMPAGIPPGAAVPVQITAGNAISNTVTIGVR